ncbi:ABC transporter permease [Isoptericola croceus]|uniref:ABC transporter permease n=1 Tax=Isoptericola croceus TaxID=3031406 RepID=UPI0023FA487D|nr:ABC transporter permease subunit [Isoptericola croceus]
MRAARRWREVVAPVLLGVVALLAWQATVVGLELRPFVVPSPTAIGEQLADHAAVIAAASWSTARNAFWGLLIGVAVALLAAAVSAAVRVVDEMSAPLVAATAVVPIVALAPVLYTMFGANAQTARIVVAAIVSFVPVYVNTLRGLRTVTPVHRDLMRVYAATRRQTTRVVTLPGALPFFFSGLRVAASVAVISALVAEYFGGPVDGLGKAITSAVSSSNYPLAWAYVAGAVVIGLVFFCATLALERGVLHRGNLRQRP